MKRSVWLKADTGNWESKKKRITAGLEAGVDWVLVNDVDVKAVRELGNIKIAAFTTNDVQVMEAEGTVDSQEAADAIIIGKKSEGDGTIELPEKLSNSTDIKAVRRGGADGAYIRILSKEHDDAIRDFAK